MKQITKLFALALSSVFALSLFAGCNGGDNGDGTNDGNQNENGNTPPSSTLPELPTPDKTVSAFTDKDVTLALDGSVNKNYSISESLFGVFLEDINYAGYLLDDNLLVNGSFETFGGNRAEGWAADTASISVQNTDGVLKNETEYGARGVNANYAAVTVTAAGGGVFSTGHRYVPIAVEKDVDYIFSAFVKSAADVNMTVSLKGASATYAEKTIAVKGGNTWVKYQATLKASDTAAAGVSFRIAFDQAGTYYLDGISLETTHAKGGIKQFVYDAIEELGPKFIRFPGGCIIEGDADTAAGGANTTEVYDWKNSVGAVQNGPNAGDDTIPAFTYTLVKDGQETTETTQGEWITRRQNGDLWGYDLEYGVGFYEFFTLCENLGASAVPVLNCGMSDLGGAADGAKGIELNGRHGKKVDDYIQDAIDLIEFAKGDKTTKWGALRAALGHEEPFEMDYVGIGNEQFGDYYTKYYEKFLQSEDFRAALEEYGVQPIVGNAMAMNDCQYPQKGREGTAQSAAEKALERGVIDEISEFGVHDQHYYVNWSALLSNYDMYDEYAMQAYDPDLYYGVFVGEYSANTAASGYPEANNELITALAEAAMMTGYERNGSVVKLAAYAPMFGVADQSSSAAYGGDNTANQWDVDMMYFTNTEIVRTANYYVQKIFMHNQGASTLFKSKLTWAGEESFVYATSKPDDSLTFNKLYYVASMTKGGDLLLKVVNVSGGAVKMNIDVQNATSRGFAYVTELSNADFRVRNTINSQPVQPVSSSVGWTGQSFGYEFKPYSLTVLRIPTQQN